MATYVIGDVHGCLDELKKLLNKIKFDRKQDKLIFIGDIINKGPKSLETIAYIMDLEESAELIIGNHELIFLATSYNYLPRSSKSSLNEILDSNRLDEIREWIWKQKFLIKINDFTITHAGLPHIWSTKKAKKRALELEFILQSESTRRLFLSNLFCLEADKWQKELEGVQRWLCIANYLTRMRLTAEDGKLNLKYSSNLSNIPTGWSAWFKLENKKLKTNEKIIFGHWAALQGNTGDNKFIAIDTGCVWGGKLSCFCIETGKMFSVASKKYRNIS